MKIGFIGGGKVGFSLGKYLKENNFDVVGYFSKNVDSIKEAANFTNTKEFYSLKEILSESDILFITTTDSEIESVWENLKKLSIKNKIICHCSGALSSEIFKGRENYNVFGYSVHPLFPIKDKYESYKSLKDAVFTVEGDETYINIIISMFSSIGNKVKEIDKNDKVKYHKSAVLVSNLVLALISIGVEELESCGFNSDEALDSLYPLIKNNIKNIKEKGLYEALTGPVERGDLETVKKHLEASTCENKDIYKLLSKKLLEIGKKKNENKDYKEMEDFLCK
ncbi:hypothetical protein HMPREF1092_02882 [Clostridium thermobutyricum]|uniref:DUF2520 domain-containing protein n=1 Tax=Clostridium thermobutyricum TaxID=29372 RepID=N9XW00_9CLOT|nr:Rossmann-like and DUF2520 domain-containing protein [Clostridium thermobutyricum]ENY99746.1 hypothetical protein HMPREF1092_02882 [Clostridium thermobutyricum]